MPHALWQHTETGQLPSCHPEGFNEATQCSNRVSLFMCHSVPTHIKSPPCSVDDPSNPDMPPFKLLSLLGLAAIASVVYATTTCNVLDYGGVADNATDIGPAITKAYADCVSGATTTNPADTVLLVPSGTYAIKTPVTFEKAKYVTVQIDGELNLVFNPALGGNIFLFDHCNYGK